MALARSTQPATLPRSASGSLAACALVALAASACTTDAVGAGYYAGPGATAITVRPVSGGAGSGVGAGTGVNGAAASGANAAGAGDARGAGTGGGTASAAGAGAIAGTSADAGAGPVGAAECDMTGRWIATHHHVADGLGQLQTGHTWSYYELAQDGERIVATRGLHCGEDVVTRTELAANVDMSSSWLGAMLQNDYSGELGTIRVSAAGCEIRFHEYYSILGATVAFYRDASKPLPTLEQPAAMAAPGWEDWDGDGQPGITLKVSGLVVGDRYVAMRVSHRIDGTVPDTQGLIRLSDQWTQDEVVYGYEGSPLLLSQGVAAADTALHFLEMARLEDTQAVGDDAATCAAIRELAPTLTPNAAQK